MLSEDYFAGLPYPAPSTRLVNLVEYVGCCDEAVEVMLANGLVSGVRRDGVWLGKTKRWGMRDRWRTDAAGHPVHVWIERPDGTVVDPTRWVFEGVWPYIYQGPNDLYADAVLPLESPETWP